MVKLLWCSEPHYTHTLFLTAIFQIDLA